MLQVGSAVPGLDVLIGDAREVSCGYEGACGQPKQLDKIIKIAVLIQRLNRPRQCDAVVCGELGERCRTYGTHHVHMQLRLGKAREKRGEVGRHWGLASGGVDAHNHRSWNKVHCGEDVSLCCFMAHIIPLEGYVD